MRVDDLTALKLDPALRECGLHVRPLHYAMTQLEGKLPLSAALWPELDDETVADIDQLLFRYAKLQDAMGLRLFPAILMLGAEWRDEETFIDKLDRLEKLGALPSAERWNELRLIRNRMTHEYPDAPEQNAENLNQVHSSIPDLEAALSQATSFAKALAARITGQDRTA